MGTKIQCKSYLPEYYSMRDLNEDSNGFSWPFYYGDKNLTNGQYYNSFMPRAVSEPYSGYDKDALKRKMLEHEAIFKDQVLELHRLYKIQRDLMEEVKSKEIHKNLMPADTSLSSSPLTSQITSEDARKWHISSFPLPNSVCVKPSVSGAEDIHSSLSSMKGSSMQAGPSPFQNGGGSKDVELFESRPTKLRKMIDLQLPAAAYIDTEEEDEEEQDEKISGMPSYLCNGNQKVVVESGAKPCVGSSEKSGCRVDASRSDSCLRSTVSVADLNEPIPVEETNNSRYLDLLGHSSRDEENEGHELSAKSKSQLQGLPKEVSLNSHYGSNNGTADNRYLENNENGRKWFSHVLDAGPSKGKLKSAPQGLQHEIVPRSTQPIQVLFNKAQDAPNFLLTNQSKVELWRERNHVISNNIHPESGVASTMSSSYPVASSSDLFNSWPHSVSSWEKPSNSLSQKSVSVQTHPFLNSSGILSRTAQASPQTYGIFGDGCHHNNHPRSNSSFESELPSRNGFYYGSSSASKEPLVQVPSVSYNYLNCSNENNVASEHTGNQGSAKVFRGGSSTIDMKSAKEVNLNVVFSPEAVPQQSLEVKDGERQSEDHVAMLPWLRAKPSCRNVATSTGRDLNVGQLSFLQSSLNHSVYKIEAGNSQIVTQNLKSGSGSNNTEASRVERSDILSNRKILGFPIFEKPHLSKNEPSPTPPSEVEMESNRKIGVLDINLPLDAAVPDLSQKIAAEALVIEKKSDVKVDIDLNAYVSEDEASLKSTVLSTNVKTVGIDLEAPVVTETEEDVIHEEANPQKAQEAPLHSPEHKTEGQQDELIRLAAEAMVAMSSSSLNYQHDETTVAISSSDSQNPLDDATCNSSEVSVKDPLNWFVQIVSSCGNDLESRIDVFLRGKNGEDNEESLSEGFDYFESMTLKLTETTEEEYVPKPLVPENFKVEEAGTSLLQNRPRKGHARRGRQRRDFQRDILPGLASLSRHEVTEDLQTFGGMMRATGHSWHSGLTRRNSTRNGCGRGRRRAIVSSPPPPPPSVAATTTCTPLVQQLTNVEVGLEDGSLTGWGKTTRRPRRQRCPAGNPPTVTMT